MENDDNSSTTITTDKNFANKLRNTNAQQFKILVRMHLSFELDITNIEDFDVTVMEKKLKKWSRKRSKGCTSKNFNSFEEDEAKHLTDASIVKLKQLIDFIATEENLCQEGVFRKTGSVARQNELKGLLQLPGELFLGNYTVHDCASVIKSFLADLSEPLLTEMYQPVYQQVAEICNSSDWNETLEQKTLVCLQLLFLLLPEKNRMLLEDINIMLYNTMLHESSNKMSSTSLATLFAPHLICPKHLSAESVLQLSLKMTSTISFMIQQGGKISEIPSKLATDIRAYFFEQKRRQTMSPEKMLDESVSETTANTVFTFVDRKKTAEENTQNQTDQALAQLYAYIQSLPESSKKKKLIKQFNKENGYGTPLQLLMLNKEKNSSGFRKVNSLGDTIKRHIFHKNLLSRTAKHSNMLTSCASSPISTLAASPKSRVLFRATTPKTTNQPALATITTHEVKFSIQTIIENDSTGETPTKDANQVSKEENKECFDSFCKMQKKHSSEPNLCKMKERRDYFSCSDLKNLATSVLNINELTKKPTLDETIENAAGSSEENLIEDFENVYCPFTSTPAKHFDRNSMSPITKSTHMMSKAMQESIMTPRSRKPVMLPQRLASSEKSKTMYHSFSSIQEMDEETLDSKATPEDQHQPQQQQLKRRSKSESNVFEENLQINENPCTNCPSLTNEFKDYLFSRSVMETSPADLSFSSQPDDFESTDEFEDMSESNINKSLLFCLDGNLPQSDASSSFNSRKRRSQPADEDAGCSGEDKLVGNNCKIKKVALPPMMMAELDETAL